MKTPVLGLSLAALTLSSAPAFAASVVYREIFPTGPSGTQEERAEAQGWVGGHTGDPFASNIVGGEGGIHVGAIAPSSEQTAVASNPIGSVPPSSFAFFSETTTSNAFFYSTEIAGLNLLSDDLISVSWDSNDVRNVNTSTTAGTWFQQGTIDGDDTHLAFRIDTGATNHWYVSQQGTLHPGANGVWANNVVTLAGLSWVVFSNGPADGSTLPGGDFLTVLASLPSGTVDAAGFYWGRKGGTNRIDNYAITADVAPVPLPAAGWLLLAGLGGMVVAGRARRART